MGLIRCTSAVSKTALKQLKTHLAQEQAAVAGDDVGLRSFLLGDFHVCLAECLGNSLLADTLRDFTARTTLIAMRYQSSHDAAHSCAEHVEIVRALEQGEWSRAEQLMQDHIGHVQSALQLQVSSDDALARLRHALQPVSKTRAGASSAQDLHTSLASPSSPDVSTYLGKLL